MFTKVLLLMCNLGFIYKADAASASFITKCPWDDSKCIKQATQATIPIFAAGIPELGVETLDPFQIKTLDASSPSLTLHLNDISGTGLKDCIAKKMQRDKEKSKIFVKFLCSVDLNAKYEMKGHLLILPIEGKGNAHVLLRKLQIAVELDIVDKDHGGANRWHIKDYKYSYDLKDKAEVQLDNLFNGNELLGRAARDLIASNSNEVVLELGPPIVKAVVGKMVNNVDKFFSAVDASELEL